MALAFDGSRLAIKLQLRGFASSASRFWAREEKTLTIICQWYLSGILSQLYHIMSNYPMSYFCAWESRSPWRSCRSFLLPLPEDLSHQQAQCHQTLGCEGGSRSKDLCKTAEMRRRAWWLLAKLQSRYERNAPNFVKVKGSDGMLETQIKKQLHAACCPFTANKIQKEDSRDFQWFPGVQGPRVIDLFTMRTRSQMTSGTWQLNWTQALQTSMVKHGKANRWRACPHRPIECFAYRWL